jgi:hypothetical protein
MWALTDKGRRMPIDPAPAEDGNLVLTLGNPNYVRVDPTWPGPKYRSHFASCPGAATHRRKAPRP